MDERPPRSVSWWVTYLVQLVEVELQVLNGLGQAERVAAHVAGERACAAAAAGGGQRCQHVSGARPQRRVHTAGAAAAQAPSTLAGALPRDMRRPRLAGGGGGASIGHGALRGVGACGGVPPARAPPQRAALAAACVRFGRRALRGSCGGRARTIEPGGRHGAREPRRAVDRGPTLGGLALLGGDLRARRGRCQPLRRRAAGSRAREEPPPRAPCAAPSWCRTGRHPSWRPSWWRPG